MAPVSNPPIPGIGPNRPMLRRLLTIVLALAIFGNGSAWAFAGAGAAGGMDGDLHVPAAMHWTHADAGHPAGACDHSCHASAHLVGLHQQPPTLSPLGADRPVSVIACLLASLPPVLPLKPPRS